MQLKIERLEEKQEDLRERLKVVEKWVIGAAAVLAAGVTVIGFATNISKAYLQKILGKVVKLTKTDMDDQLLEAVSKAIKARDEQSPSNYKY